MKTNNKLKLGMGADHAGYEYKADIKAWLEELGHAVNDFGTNGPDSVDYPDYVHPLANALESNELELGILICGSANGVCMTANKHQNIRAAIAWQPVLGELARQHNNANVICIPARFVSLNDAKEIVKAFIDTDFEGGRHERRVNKIALEQ